MQLITSDSGTAQHSAAQHGTCKGFLIGFGPVEVALGDIGALDAHLPDLATWHQLVLLVQNAHLQHHHHHHVLSPHGHHYMAA